MEAIQKHQGDVNFFLELKGTSMNCLLGSMGEESLLCHLLVRGLLPSKEKLREKTIVETKGGELKDANISALISLAEMYRQSSKKKGEFIHKVELVVGQVELSKGEEI